MATDGVFCCSIRVAVVAVDAVAVDGDVVHVALDVDIVDVVVDVDGVDVEDVDVDIDVFVDDHYVCSSVAGLLCSTARPPARPQRF